MSSFELHRKITHFFSESEQVGPFLTVVSQLAKTAEEMSGPMAKIAAGGTMNDAAARLNGHLARAHSTTSAMVSQRLFYKSLEDFQEALTKLNASHPLSPGITLRLIQQVEDFSDLYDRFITNGSGTNALPLLLGAQDLQARLETFLQCLEMFDEFVGSDEVARSAESPLEIWLPAQFGLKDFAQRLLALHEIYSEICMLLSVSESEYPLRISKIESGSLWAKVFGESKVIDLLITFVRETASWMFKRYTSEGKVSAIPQKIEAIDAVLGLSSRLRAAGIDTSEINDHIQKSTFLIAKELSVLLDGQSSITINEQTLTVDAQVALALSAQPETPRLENHAGKLPSLGSTSADESDNG